MRSPHILGAFGANLLSRSAAGSCRRSSVRRRDTIGRRAIGRHGGNRPGSRIWLCLRLEIVLLGFERCDLDIALRKPDREVHELPVDRLDILRECAQKKIAAFLDL